MGLEPGDPTSVHRLSATAAAASRNLGGFAAPARLQSAPGRGATSGADLAGRRPPCEPPISVSARHRLVFVNGRQADLYVFLLLLAGASRAWSCGALGPSTPARAGPSATSSPSSTRSRPLAAPRSPRPSSSRRSGISILQSLALPCLWFRR